ncbi:MAG: YjhG/YagF family D-xylonate dehydratase, partial [Gemmatimonadetes bacterium]|nr:YjhG/YagF family D-xylonate dehydratase [Gemmatimonadota bacterium]
LEVIVDTRNLEGSINLVGHGEDSFEADRGAEILAERPPRDDLAAEEDLPEETRLWAALQNAGGGTWGGCIYDVDAIIEQLEAGRAALENGADG